MRALFCSAVALAFWTPARADDPNPAMAVIDAAIKAHGGLENLAKTQGMKRTAAGTISFFGQEVAFTDEMIVKLPERWRWTFEGGPQGQKTRFVVVYNGGKAWQSAAGGVTEVTKDRLREIGDEVYRLWIVTLAPLKTEKGFSLIALADSKVNGRDASCVLVSRQGQSDLKLFFDRATGLLVKIERKTKEAGIPTEKAYFYSGHTDVDGVKLPSKYIEESNGKKVVDVSTISYQLLPRADDSLFEKP